jgi:hypothetical protein
MLREPAGSSERSKQPLATFNLPHFDLQAKTVTMSDIQQEKNQVAQEVSLIFAASR